MFSQERNFTSWQLTGFGDAPAFIFQTIDSTHKLMKAKALAGEIQPGTLFVADAQSDGHGRHERTWDSPAGKNLYFNILIPLDGIAPASAPQITQVAALTFAEVFRDLQDGSNAQGLGNRDIGKVTVKWPNDILCGKSKFCGILAELVYIKTSTAIPKTTHTSAAPSRHSRRLQDAPSTAKSFCRRSSAISNAPSGSSRHSASRPG